MGRLKRLPQSMGLDLGAITAPVSLRHRLAETRCPGTTPISRTTTGPPLTNGYVACSLIRPCRWRKNGTAIYDPAQQEHRASMVAPRRAGTPDRYVAQPPVTANQTPTPAGPVTKMIGAMQGLGRLTMAVILEFPAASALKLSVLMLVIAAEPSAPMLWQLTMARKSGNGFVPRSAAGTDGWSARTSPCTFTSR